MIFIIYFPLNHLKKTLNRLSIASAKFQPAESTTKNIVFNTNGIKLLIESKMAKIHILLSISNLIHNK